MEKMTMRICGQRQPGTTRTTAGTLLPPLLPLLLLVACGGLAQAAELCDVLGYDAFYNETVQGTTRIMSYNSCPNHWAGCMKKQCSSYMETMARVQNETETAMAYPVIAAPEYRINLTCSKGAIGVALNGVKLYGQGDAGFGDDCGAAVPLQGDTYNVCGGHSAGEPGSYAWHYHAVPPALLDQLGGAQSGDGGHSPQVGWAFDGFPIYGPYGPDGVMMKPCHEPTANDTYCLDRCNGYEGRVRGMDKFKYRYYMTGQVPSLECSTTVRNSDSGVCQFNQADGTGCCQDTLPAASFSPFLIDCYKGCRINDGPCKANALGAGTLPLYTAEAKEPVTDIYIADAVAHLYPTTAPTGKPTARPTGTPTQHPSDVPSTVPSMHPSVEPSMRPSGLPSHQPTEHPSHAPTLAPSVLPSTQPTAHPSELPSQHPTHDPTHTPTTHPTTHPSRQPTTHPTTNPSQHPTTHPTHGPTSHPTKHPSRQPTTRPTTNPSQHPTTHPTHGPTFHPTRQPSRQPTTHPTAQPSPMPTLHPSAVPTATPTLSPTGIRFGLIETDVTLEGLTTEQAEEPDFQTAFIKTMAIEANVSEDAVEITNITDAASSSASRRHLAEAAVTVDTAITVADKEANSSLEVLSSALENTTAFVEVLNNEIATVSNVSSNGTSGSNSSDSVIVVSGATVNTIVYVEPIITDTPTLSPTLAPSALPSQAPTPMPSSRPTLHPSPAPSGKPTMKPSMQPSLAPSSVPSAEPSSAPSPRPSPAPTMEDPPTRAPSTDPTLHPSNVPSTVPSPLPSALPTMAPTLAPTQMPTKAPSAVPTMQPSPAPTVPPTPVPTPAPSQGSAPATSAPTGNGNGTSIHGDDGDDAIFYDSRNVDLAIAGGGLLLLIGVCALGRHCLISSRRRQFKADKEKFTAFENVFDDDNLERRSHAAAHSAHLQGTVSTHSPMYQTASPLHTMQSQHRSQGPTSATGLRQPYSVQQQHQLQQLRQQQQEVQLGTIAPSQTS